MSEPGVNTLTGIPVASQQFANSIIGPAFAAWAFQLLTAGFAFRQCIEYVQTPRWKSDPRWLKLLVLCVMIGLAAQTGITYASVYHYGSWQARDEDTLYAQTFTDCFSNLPTALTGAIVQSYLAFRASRMIARRTLRILYLSFMNLCLVGAVLGSVLYVVLSFSLRGAFADDLPPGLTFNVASGLWAGGFALVDLLVTISLVLFLRARIAHFNERSDSMLRSLGWLAVHSSSYTAVFAITGATLAFCFPDGSLLANTSIAFFPPLCSFYSISLLTTLAGRDSIRLRNAVPTGEANLSLAPVTLSGYTPSHSRGTGGHLWRGSRSQVVSAPAHDSVTVDLEAGGSEKSDGK